MSSSFDYLDLCRLCLVKDRVTVPIFEAEGDVRQIFLKITACLPVKVSRDDKLPKKICDDCVYKVETFYQFWNTTANAEKQLLQWLCEVGGLEDKQGYEVLDSNVMKQEQGTDSRLDGNVMQVGGHQNNMDMGMMDNMSLITMSTGSEQQFTSVPMDASGTVQAVPGPSTQTHEVAQSQTGVSHIVEEEEESEEDENSDEGCDNEEGLPVKEETEEGQSDQTLEPTQFVSLPCDEAGPSGLQQQKMAEMSEMTMQQTADGDPKTGYPEDSADVETITDIIPTTKTSNASVKTSSMMLYQISYVNGKPTYSLIPIKKKDKGESPKKATNDLVCEECGLRFATESRLQWHRSTHDPLKNRKQARIKQMMKEPTKYQMILPKPNKYVVKSYGEPVKLEIPEVQQQPRTNDKGLTFICPSCEFSTSERAVMINHFTSTHCFKTEPKAEPKDDEVVYENYEPDPTIGAEEEVIDEPYAEEVETEQLQCAECGFTGYTQDDIDFHTCAPAPEEQQLFTCPLCTYECLTRMGLQSHITRKHKPKPAFGMPRTYECNECPFKCHNKNTLYSHKRKHKRGTVKLDEEETEEKNYFCNECDFSAKTKSSLYLHIRRRHKSENVSRPDVYTCEHCDYTNKNRYEMKVHVIRKHTNDYPHACEVCGKKYKIKGDLTNHIRFQHREQPIICDVCGKTCGNSNSLYVHQKFAHYKAEFECPICHRRMVTQANLDEHILKQHEQREDAVCEECGKRFTRNSRLKIHMRIHTGVKPYACKVCGKAFSRKTALRQHLLIHTGQRPYVCDLCGKAFTQKPGLISHRKKSHPGNHPPLPRVTIDHVLSEFLEDVAQEA